MSAITAAAAAAAAAAPAAAAVVAQHKCLDTTSWCLKHPLAKQMFAAHRC
jgi:hypothetical protein